MDVDTLWTLYRELSQHVETLNREIGTLAARMGWVEWWVKLLVAGTFVNSALGVLNAVIVYRNGKKR